MSGEENNYNYDNYNPIGSNPPPPPPPPMQPVPENPYRTGFGIASMVLGCAALVFFMMLINIPLAIAAIVLGSMQLIRYRNKGFAVVGISAAVLSIILMIAGWVVVFSSVANMDDSQMEKFRQDFEEEYQIELEENEL